MNGADVTINNGYGIVLSVHTPGNLSGERLVENLTNVSTGVMSNLGSTFHYNNCDLALFNIYVFGSDTVRIRNMHVNEANAEQDSHLTIGEIGYNTHLNCNLCQVYDNAVFTVDQATIDTNDPTITPSATSSFDDLYPPPSHGIMNFHDMDLRDLQITAIQEGTVNIYNCQYDPDKLYGNLANIHIYNVVPVLSIPGVIMLLAGLSIILYNRIAQHEKRPDKMG